MKKRKVYEMSFKVSYYRTVEVEAGSLVEAIDTAYDKEFEDLPCEADVDFDEVLSEEEVEE